MINYIHKGLVKTNGIVDTSQEISDAAQLRVVPSDDRHHLVSPDIGNFEWWYFDVIDIKTNCILKIIAHLGTDPLRSKFYPQIAVTIITPTRKHTILKPYVLKDFHASAEYCDVKIKNEFHTVAKSNEKSSVYQVKVNIDEFNCSLGFTGEIEGWKPLGNEVKMDNGKKKGALFWVIPVPRAKVVGEFSYGNETYRLQDAIGYHDHNYWKADISNKLFLDEVVSHWHWGRFLAKDYSAIFMETHLMNHSITSFMIAKGNDIIHSSNNGINLLMKEYKKDQELKTRFPTKIVIASREGDEQFQMTLHAIEIIDKRDLLDGINPFWGWLIKRLVSRPAYFGILAECSLKISGDEIKGPAIYETMTFRSKKAGH